MRNEKEFEVVVDIRIKQTKKKNGNKTKKDNTSLTTKIFVWIMFVAMLASVLVPIIIFLAGVISGD